jgi:hypothetical protein
MHWNGAGASCLEPLVGVDPNSAEAASYLKRKLS